MSRIRLGCLRVHPKSGCASGVYAFTSGRGLGSCPFGIMSFLAWMTSRAVSARCCSGRRVLMTRSLLVWLNLSACCRLFTPQVTGWRPIIRLCWLRCAPLGARQGPHKQVRLLLSTFTALLEDRYLGG